MATQTATNTTNIPTASTGSTPPTPPTPVQSPLTAIATLIAPVEQSAQAIMAVLPSFANTDLSTVNTIHFARFCFLDNMTKFACITSYDGDFDTYIRAFANTDVMNIFNAILPYVEGGAALVPINKNVTAFGNWLASIDATHGDPNNWGFWFSAYPTQTVLNILANTPPTTK